MRHYFAYLFVGLLAFTFIQTGAMGNNANQPDACCFKYYARRIPISKIESYRETREACTKPGVILTTQRGLKICVDPQLSWVNETMQIIDDRTF